MEILISDSGDYSVGIWSARLEITLNIDIQDKEEREDIRQKSIKFFQELTEPIGRIRATFNDECADCGELLENKICTNKSCVVNWAKEQYDNEAKTQ